MHFEKLHPTNTYNKKQSISNVRFDVNLQLVFHLKFDEFLLLRIIEVAYSFYPTPKPYKSLFYQMELPLAFLFECSEIPLPKPDK